MSATLHQYNASASTPSTDVAAPAKLRFGPERRVPVLQAKPSRLVKGGVLEYLCLH